MNGPFGSGQYQPVCLSSVLTDLFSSGCVHDDKRAIGGVADHFVIVYSAIAATDCEAAAVRRDSFSSSAAPGRKW